MSEARNRIAQRLADAWGAMDDAAWPDLPMSPNVEDRRFNPPMSAYQQLRQSIMPYRAQDAWLMDVRDRMPPQTDDPLAVALGYNFIGTRPNEVVPAY